MATHIEIPFIHKKIKPPSRWVFGLLAIGLFALGTVGTNLIRNQGMGKDEIAQLTVPVEAKNITLRITTSGKVTPIQSVNISPKNPGILAQLLVEQGDRVKKGQVIAKMNSDDIQARILQLRANIAQAQAQLDQAKAGSRPQEISQAIARLAQAQAQLEREKTGNRPQEIDQAIAQVDAARSKAIYTAEQVRRFRYLVGQGAEKRQLLDQAISEDRTAQANLREAEKRLSLQKTGSRSEDIAQRQAAVAEARAALQLAQSGSRPEEIAQRQAAVAAAQAQLRGELVNLEDSIIRAPFDGTIAQKYANIGAFVTPTTSASTSASATSSSIVGLVGGLEILANVPEADIGRIKVGQKVEIVSDAFPDRVFQGKVRLIAPEAVKEEGVTLFQVRVKIDTGASELRSGLNADLTFLGDDVAGALMVPTVAILTEKGNTGVLVPDAQNKPQFRGVTIGSQIKDQTQIINGIKQGERIFLNPPKEYQMQKQMEKMTRE